MTERFSANRLMGELDQEQGATLYRELRRLAAYYMKMERNGHTLQPTALVHEAILRVYDGVMPSASSQKQIIATDIAEVIGTAIAINLLIPKIPLVAGCALSIADVLLILLFYKPNGSMKGLRAFEMFVVVLVLGVVICFCVQLSMIKGTSVGEVFLGFLPSRAIIQSQG